MDFENLEFILKFKQFSKCCVCWMF